jgi:Outer membrane protein beta-barrel domain
MVRRITAPLILLCAGCISSLHAQDSDFGRLNFNIGGGLSVPLNPTARYVGVNGNGTSGLGANFDKYNSVEGDFLWVGLPPYRSLDHPIFTPDVNVNLFALTGQYRFHVDSIDGSPFGVYLLVGGGWYFRDTDISRRLYVPQFTPCQPIYNWWGLACGANGYVSTANSSHGSSAGGANGGIGFTIRLGDGGWKFFAESRYHYVWSNFVPTTFVPISFGFRYN